MALRRFASILLLAGGSATAIVACGTRTGLLVTDEVTTDATPDHKEAGKDAADAGVDADAREEDALPFLDVQKDSPKPPPLGCLDAGDTQIYLITSQNELLAFYPPTLAFTTIGHINCPNAGGTPFSMGVERSGTAYSVFTNGKLFRISTANAACQATAYVTGQQGYSTFGMGYAGDQQSESLYVSDNANGKGLATIDTTTFKLSYIGAYAPALPQRCEMTGTGNNELFAYCIQANSTGGVVAQIDRTTAKVVAASPVKVGTSADAFAFAYWGGDFFMFNSPGGPTSVTRYDPVLKTETVVASHPSTIVGAGVSTCAPN
jgi:hypothetical protein